MTDFAECPACGDDGPHLVVPRPRGDYLECKVCDYRWPSPFTNPEGTDW